LITRDGAERSIANTVANVRNNDGVLICKSELVFTELRIERLRNFTRNHAVQKRVRVRVPEWAAKGTSVLSVEMATPGSLQGTPE
jgi:hypothetical protein